jgi:hypothetical protein
MASAPPASENSKSPAGPNKRVPPEEQFWKRYSPHGEFPLSATGSVAVHVLVFGVLVLFAIYLAGKFFRDRPLPIEPVRLHVDGGGGGDKKGVGDGPGIGTGAEDTGEGDPGEQPGKADRPPPVPALTKAEKSKIKVKFDDPTARYIQKNDTDNARAWVRLDDSMRNKLRDGLNPGRGKGGPGKGGGEGTGSGPGKGSGKGPGESATLTQREKRMLRWNMHFPTRSAAEYIRQLRILGAILAIPVVDGPEPEYRIVRDLSMKRRPAPLLVEDVSKIQRIYWIDDKPESVRDVMEALGLSMRPSRFVAFMPVELENSLFQMEKKYMKQKYGRFNEDEIYETRFRVVPSGGTFKPVLVSMKLKRGG